MTFTFKQNCKFFAFQILSFGKRKNKPCCVGRRHYSGRVCFESDIRESGGKFIVSTCIKGKKKRK